MAGIEHRFLPGIRAVAQVQYQVAGFLNRWNDLHLAQGAIEQACGFYSTCMALMILSGVPRNTIERLPQLTRGPLSELWQLAHPLLYEGTDNPDIRSYVEVFSHELRCEILRSSSPSRIGQAAASAITAGHVPILGFASRSWEHFSAVVGVESVADEPMPRALLTLDSSQPAPRLAAFNGRLGLGPEYGTSSRASKPFDLPYHCVSGDSWAVRVRSLVIVRRAQGPP